MSVKDNRYAFCFLTAKDCGTLAVPLDGSINGRETTFPNEATFNCDEGFILNGSTFRRCQSDGTWSGIHTSCHGEIITCSSQDINRTIELFRWINRSLRESFSGAM